MRIEGGKRALRALRERGRAWGLATAALVLGACAMQHMKPPIHPTSVWRVEGHQQRKNQRDRALRIGPFAVEQVSGTPLAAPNMAAYGRAPDRRSWEYTFVLRGPGVGLQARCTEEVDQARWHGMGSMLLTLACTCAEGERQRATVTLEQERGALTLGDQRYELTAAHLSARGESVRPVLGYRITRDKHEGGVEITEDARAYVPRALAEDEHAALACAYAGLLLFREVK